MAGCLQKNLFAVSFGVTGFRAELTVNRFHDKRLIFLIRRDHGKIHALSLIRIDSGLDGAVGGHKADHCVFTVLLDNLFECDLLHIDERDGQMRKDGFEVSVGSVAGDHDGVDVIVFQSFTGLV